MDWVTITKKIGGTLFAGRKLDLPLIEEAVANDSLMQFQPTPAHISNHRSTCYSKTCVLFYPLSDPKLPRHCNHNPAGVVGRFL
jgi:hypothetical protein